MQQAPTARAMRQVPERSPTDVTQTRTHVDTSTERIRLDTSPAVYRVAIDPTLAARSSRRLRCPFPEGGGPGKKKGVAKLCDEKGLSHVLARIELLSKCPECDAVQVLLAHRAGLRPCEIARLKWRTLLDATGDLKENLEVMGGTSKRGKFRSVPIHPQLRDALLRLRRAYPEAAGVAFWVTSWGEIRYRSDGEVSKWFTEVYRGAGLRGCTGHTGRRSFGTALGSFAPAALVKQVLGHASLKTTGSYLEATGDAKAAIANLGIRDAQGL